MAKLDKELEFYRSLMEPPDTFDEGFTWSSLIGAIFIALIMVPGSIYMGLMMGQGLGGPSQWVMVILFIEIAKRTHQVLTKAQIFVLFYMTSAAMAVPFRNLLWNQFFVRSQAVIGQGMVDQIPVWVAPTDPAVLATRNFFDPAWWPAIGMVLFSLLIGRVDNAVLSYGLFNPMAPIGAQGIAALAEDMEERQKGRTSTRWQAFAIGGALGLVFGFVYIGLPTLTDAFFHETIKVLPIPFSDWTGKTQDFLPAVATGLSYNMGFFVVGMVIPFWACVGAVVGFVITCVLNPLLYLHGKGQFKLSSWRKGDSTIETIFKNRVDFYFSFGLGISLAIAAIGIGSIVRNVLEQRRHRTAERAVIVPKSRGDIPTWFIVGFYFLSTTIYITVSMLLLRWHDGRYHMGIFVVLLIYGFLYTPLVSYATARLEGMIGRTLPIPFVREAGLILSGYEGIACWFLPMPMHDYGRRAMFYRQAELTGTRFTSIWKTEAILVPFIIMAGILYMQFIWSMGEVPSPAYPFADMMWELNARNQVLMYSATTGGYSQFFEAFKPWVIGTGFTAAMVVFMLLRTFNAPTMLLFGCIQGLDQTLPHSMFPQFAGALFARLYLEKRFGGRKQWRRYAPVLSAGFGCGVGLIGMFTIGVKFMSRAVFKTPF